MAGAGSQGSVTVVEVTVVELVRRAERERVYASRARRVRVVPRQRRAPHWGAAFAPGLGSAVAQVQVTDKIAVHLVGSARLPGCLG